MLLWTRRRRACEPRPSTTASWRSAIVGLALVTACDRGPSPTLTTAPRNDGGDTTPPTAVTPTCPSERASPLLVQASAERVATLEATMERGLAVVAFDCTEVVPLPSCELAGQYQFVERPRIDVDRRFASKQETEATRNLLGRPSPPLQIEAGEVIELQLASLGFERAPVARVARRDLRGDCARATHFVRAARVGAYSLTSTRGTTFAEKKGGSIEACKTIDPKTRRPEPGCRAPLQLEVIPLAP